MTDPVRDYASLAEFQAQPEFKSDDAVDDTYILDLLTRASRAVDVFCGTWFYSQAQTRTFDLPRNRFLELDVPLLTATIVSNGDGSVIPATYYNLDPNNGPNKNRIALKQSSFVYWLPSLGGDTEGVVSVVGTWGYVDRGATDPESAVVIQNTTDATLNIALSAYKKRYGQGVEGVAQVTAAGVVITPRGIPAEAKQLLMPYRRIT